METVHQIPAHALGPRVHAHHANFAMFGVMAQSIDRTAGARGASSRDENGERLRLGGRHRSLHETSDKRSNDRRWVAALSI